jgi:hypothetical protein
MPTDIKSSTSVTPRRSIVATTLLRNGRDEQIAILDSQLRWTLSRFCSIAWFGTVILFQ